jgi:NADH:ubiquinone oxidoreductase subunit 2 (subunit N)
VPGSALAEYLPPLIVVIPAISACFLIAVGAWLPRWAADAVATGTAAGVTGLAAALLTDTTHGRVVVWIGGWRPAHGLSVGIPLIADQLNAGFALLIGGLVSCALLYSWRFMESIHGRYYALVLLFFTGMEGFAVTGDVFDMFVFFELMGAAAYALTGMKIEDESSVQGGLVFGIISSFGAYLSLAGVAILYSRYGQLGLPQLGALLGHHRPDALVIVAFTLILAGFLVKAAIVPFHFWLADAHAVAPSPVCALFSGAMVELGLYAVARVYWTVFSGTIPHPDVTRAFIVFGALTAALGAVMCFLQRHIKRLLAYSTVAYVGLFTMGFASLNVNGTAGAALYVAGHAGEVRAVPAGRHPAWQVRQRRRVPAPRARQARPAGRLPVLHRRAAPRGSAGPVGSRGAAPGTFGSYRRLCGLAAVRPRGADRAARPAPAVTRLRWRARDCQCRSERIRRITVRPVTARSPGDGKVCACQRTRVPPCPGVRCSLRAVPA